MHNCELEKCLSPKRTYIAVTCNTRIFVICRTNEVVVYMVKTSRELWTLCKGDKLCSFISLATLEIFPNFWKTKVEI